MSTQTINLDLLKRSFPDFDLETLPQIPSDWEDSSYVNDVCPSFQVGAGITIFVDYQKREDRELAEWDMPRFQVGCNCYSAETDWRIQTDDWSEVLMEVRALKLAEDMQFATSVYDTEKEFIEATRRGDIKLDYSAYTSIVTKEIDFSTQLLNIVDGMRFVKFLIDTDQMFHLEDNPFDIINIEGKRLFDDKTAAMVRERQDELYDMDWSLVGDMCPIGWYYAIVPSEGSPFFGTIQPSED